MRSTIRQVAERAGVSRTTVSNVLLGRNDIVAAEKREMVLQAVQELQYIPVRSALQNRHVTTRIIALSLGEPRKVWWAINTETYKGMCESALTHGYDLLTLLRPDPDWALDRREVQFLDRRSDGFIFASPLFGEKSETFEMLARAGIPTVVCYRRDVPAQVAWVDPDNCDAIFRAVEYLVSKGHRRIAYLSEMPPYVFDARERRRFFEDATVHFSLSECANWIFNADYKQMAGVAGQILARGATAVVCYNDSIAHALISEMKLEGLRVPGDLSLVGVDDLPESAALGLTTLGFSYCDVGRFAVDALVAQIDGQKASDCCHVLPVHFQERSSVRDLRM